MDETRTSGGMNDDKGSSPVSETTPSPRSTDDATEAGRKPDAVKQAAREATKEDPDTVS